MKEIFTESVFFGMLLSLGAYQAGCYLRKKTGWALMNPMLVAIVLVICFLLCTGISYESYMKGAHIISDMITPATVCLALPLYQQFDKLRKNATACMTGIIAGIIASCFSILAMVAIFRLEHFDYVTLLPKSITTAMGIGVSEELGGNVAITVVSIVITGVTGNVFAEKFLKLIRVESPIAKGIAIGTSSHAVGTARAMEMGPVEGAMSSLSLVVCGILTVLAASLFAMLW